MTFTGRDRRCGSRPRRPARARAGSGFADAAWELPPIGGDYAAAERIYPGRSLHARRPGYPDALLGLAAIEARKGRLEAALSLQRVASGGPASRPCDLLGETEEAAGDLGRPWRLRGRGRGLRRLDAAGRERGHRAGDLPCRSRQHPARAARSRLPRLAVTPSVRAADAVPWALSAAGRVRASLRFSHPRCDSARSIPLSSTTPGSVSLRGPASGGALRQLLSRLLEQQPAIQPAPF